MEYYNLTFLVVGNGLYEKELKEKVIKMGHRENWSIETMVNEVGAVYQQLLKAR